MESCISSVPGLAELDVRPEVPGASMELEGAVIGVVPHDSFGIATLQVLSLLLTSCLSINKKTVTVVSLGFVESSWYGLVTR
jgi:hypothetical protein